MIGYQHFTNTKIRNSVSNFNILLKTFFYPSRIFYICITNKLKQK